MENKEDKKDLITEILIINILAFLNIINMIITVNQKISQFLKIKKQSNTTHQTNIWNIMNLPIYSPILNIWKKCKSKDKRNKAKQDKGQNSMKKNIKISIILEVIVWCITCIVILLLSNGILTLINNSNLIIIQIKRLWAAVHNSLEKSKIAILVLMPIHILQIKWTTLM